MGDGGVVRGGVLDSLISDVGVSGGESYMREIPDTMRMGIVFFYHRHMVLHL